MSKVKVAVIQLPQQEQYDTVQENLNRAKLAIEKLAVQDETVKLVVLPEFVGGCGYGSSSSSSSYWERAEIVPNGPTITCFKQVAMDTLLSIAGTVLEVTSNGEFYNTFFFIEPSSSSSKQKNDDTDTTENTMVRMYTCRQSEPIGIQTYIFQGDTTDSPVFETNQFGTIGVSIGYETMLLQQQYRLLNGLEDWPSADKPKPKKTPIDLLLCPCSIPTMNECFPIITHNSFLEMNRIIEQTPMRLAKLYGIPVLMSATISSSSSSSSSSLSSSSYPFPWSILYRKYHTFYGFSSICSGDGFWLDAAKNNIFTMNEERKYRKHQEEEKEKEENQEEGLDEGVEIMVAVVYLGEDNRKMEKVELDLMKLQQPQPPQEKKKKKSSNKGQRQYIVTLPSYFPLVWNYFMEPMGKWSYTRSYKRRLAAAQRAIERGNRPSTYVPSSTSSSSSSWSNTTAVVAVLGVGAAAAIYTKNSKK